MKGNDGTGNVVERDDWQTPQWLFDLLNKEYKFGWDNCASEDNHKCRLWTDDYLNVKVIDGSISWMNPPFSKAKEMFEHFFKIEERGVAIYRCDNMETSIWQDVILKHASWVVIPKGRINYEGKSGKGSRFPSALIGLGVKPFSMENAVTLLVKPSQKGTNMSTEDKE